MNVSVNVYTMLRISYPYFQNALLGVYPNIEGSSR